MLYEVNQIWKVSTFSRAEVISGNKKFFEEILFIEIEVALHSHRGNKNTL